METIHDVRGEVGNPREGDPSGPPVSITGAFGEPSVLYFAALFIFLLGAGLTAFGIVTFIIPITVVGVLIMLAGGMVYARARMPD